MSDKGSQSNIDDDMPVLSLELTDKTRLYKSYMSFVKNGALFVPTTKKFALGDNVFLSIRLMQEPTPYRLKGRVVWVTPTQTSTNPQGAGVQLLGNEGKALQQKIDVYLAGMSNSDKPTDTI